MNRRHILRLALAGALVLPFGVQAAAPLVEVYKSATCGCCEAWVAHLREHGLRVKATNVEDPEAWRARLGMPAQFGSCHTARVAGYLLEGHVPAADIRRLLASRPKALGLAVPGMPQGSPGMESPRPQAYDVLLVQADGRHAVFQHYPIK